MLIIARDAGIERPTNAPGTEGLAGDSGYCHGYVGIQRLTATSNHR